MKLVTAIILSVSLILGISAVSPSSADAAAKSYKNCKALNKDYKGGVAKSSNVKNKGGKTKHSPHVSADLYNANTKLDRDGDGIACEK
ncbi:excalibur calcium-binding domain-containing protein [Metabacillus fastidiosus]|uniref:excalibur calcium-binding domain-containing protein n=1 Tax=Metabacillus fastidiosus TaxID=1458 RepID=UPI002DBF043A|nr:excalibur calcium-binding domain-containing protein [Metabacillus fastidiosus]MEC2077502.1 excalibur calcium-binding domain-containing protein [Metabacillus fastidiosus]